MAKVAGTNGINLSKLSKADLVQVLSQVLANGDAPVAPVEEKGEAPKTSKQQADDLIEASPFTHTTGRVYLSGAHVEAAARVLKTGKPELVPTVEGKRKTAAVVLWLQNDDSVAAQNLRKSVAAQNLRKA